MFTFDSVLLLLLLLGRGIVISGIISKTTIATNRWHKNEDEDEDNRNTMDIMNNNKTNIKAEWRLMQPEVLYDGEDCSTDAFYFYVFFCYARGIKTGTHGIIEQK